MFRKPAIRRSVRRALPCLAIEALEDRVVPTNNLSIGNVGSVNVFFDRVGSTITVLTTAGNAQVDIDDLETQLKTPGVSNVVLSTALHFPGIDAAEAGNITWDHSIVGRDLSTIGINSGISLTFRPDAAAPGGLINIIGAAFGTGPVGGRLNLDFDTVAITAAGAGDINFQPQALGSAVAFGPLVGDLVVRSTNGAITYADGPGGGPVAVSGNAGFVTSDTVTLANSAGIDVPGNIGIRGTDVTISGGSSLTSDFDLTILGTGTVALGGINLKSNFSTVSVNGATVTVGGTIQSLDELSIKAASGAATIGSSNLRSFEASVSVIANGAIAFGGQVIAPGGALFLPGVGGAITLTSDGTVTADQIVFDGTVDGAFNLTLDATTTSFANSVGSTTPLGTLLLSTGNLTSAGNPIFAANFLVGGMLPDDQATLGAGIGVIHANVTVSNSGNLAPGGIGVVGTMTIQGDLAFMLGDYALDVESAAVDRIDLIGAGADLTINGGRLGNETSTGLRTLAGNSTIISYTGTQSGSFANAPLGKPFFFSGDALQVTNYTPAVTIARADANPGNSFAGSDDDGTGYTAKMTGPGELVAFADPEHFLNIVTRNTTTLSNVSLTARANASDDLVKVANVSINGALGTFAASPADISTSFNSAGTVKSIAIHDLLFLGNTAAIGGAATDKTTLKGNNLQGAFTTGGQLALKAADVEGLDIVAKGIGSIAARSISGNINSTGFPVGAVTATQTFAANINAKSVASVKAANLSLFTINTTEDVGSLTATGQILGEVNARAIGTVKAGTTLASSLSWNVANGVKSLTAGAIKFFDLQAKFLGAMSAIGNAVQHLSGDISFSSVILTGNDGTPALSALKSVTAKGTVLNSLFKAEEGNVGTVTVGRFIRSQLYLDYSQTFPFETPSGFDSLAHFKLNKFSTTATTMNDPTNAYNFAFAGSEIAADTIGTVRLSGLNVNNFGQTFGIKFQTTGGSVQVKTANNPAIALNTNLIASSAPQAGDFFFIDV